MTIDNVMICPRCYSSDTFQFEVPQSEYSLLHGTGSFIMKCHCNECNNDFKLYADFECNITNYKIRR